MILSLWRCYINVTIIILDSMHSDIFYLKRTMGNVRI
jgi:hypothetical protein